MTEPRQSQPLIQDPDVAARPSSSLLLLQGPHSPAPLFEVPEQAVISLAAKRTDSTPEAARPEGLELPTAGADSLRQAPVHPAVELGAFTAFLISTCQTGIASMAKCPCALC